MVAFEVYLNGKKLCVAGTGQTGMVGAHVYWVRHKEGLVRTHTGKTAKQIFTLEVSGLSPERDEHLRWQRRKVRLGDEIRIRVTDKAAADRPRTRERRDPTGELRAQKKYVRQMARKFGWKIQVR
jgi:hypothetical protein